MFADIYSLACKRHCKASGTFTILPNSLHSAGSLHNKVHVPIFKMILSFGSSFSCRICRMTLSIVPLVAGTSTKARAITRCFGFQRVGGH